MPLKDVAGDLPAMFCAPDISPSTRVKIFQPEMSDALDQDCFSNVCISLRLIMVISVPLHQRFWRPQG